VRLLSLAFLLSGFSGLLYQTVWQRMLAPFAGSDVLSATPAAASAEGAPVWLALVLARGAVLA
jgi:hypothetical protein